MFIVTILRALKAHRIDEEMIEYFQLILKYYKSLLEDIRTQQVAIP